MNKLLAPAHARSPVTTPATTPVTPSPKLEPLDAVNLAQLVLGSNDFVVWLDADGVVQSAQSHQPPLQVLCSTWIGRHWPDTVTTESRDKVENLLLEALGQGRSQRWRQVNHLPVAGSADDWPVSWATQRVTHAQTRALQVVASGRDLRATVQLQRRLVESQQAMERDYWRFREAETRYRTLFQSAPEAVLILENTGLKVQEANPAALALLTLGGAKVLGSPLLSLLHSSSAPALQTLLADVRNAGSTRSERLRLANAVAGSKGALVELTAALFRQEHGSYWLLRLWPLAETRDSNAKPGAVTTPATPSAQGRSRPGAAPESGITRWLEAYAEQASDGLVFADLQGRILMANPAFAGLAQLSSATLARGQNLDRWLGATGVECAVLISQLRQRGAAGLFSTRLRGEFGAQLEVEVAASLLPLLAPTAPGGMAVGPAAGASDDAAPKVLAFAVRDIGRRAQVGTPAPDKMARSASELTELVGRVPMKDIVSETADLIEKLCIETALQMTGDNRALAAQLLGLSRQSLYVKLRRFGLGDLDREPAVDPAP